MAEVEPIVVEAFSSAGPFAGLKKRQLLSLAGAARKTFHAAGHEVASEGRGGLAFHVITAGDATVVVGGTARRTLYPGDYFGEISMIDGLPRSATVVAGSEGMTSFALNRTQFWSILEKDPAVMRAVLIGLCGRIRASESSL